jgi:hypothetical protein
MSPSRSTQRLQSPDMRGMCHRVSLDLITDLGVGR